MDVTILRFEEAEPATYPDLTTYDTEGEAIDAVKPDRALWERMELYICRRWTPRQCVWTVNGPGEWHPHLSPVSAVSVDVWDSDSFTWDAVTLDQTPFGYCLPDNRTYRITATAGDTPDPVPQIVVEAYMRLRDYALELTAVPSGASSSSIKMGAGYDEEFTRSAAWMAKAMQFSGAGDLLRSYRRL